MAIIFLQQSCRFYLPWTHFYPLFSKKNQVHPPIPPLTSLPTNGKNRESASQKSRPPPVAPRIKVRKSWGWKCFVPCRICSFCPSLQASHAPGCSVGAGNSYWCSLMCHDWGLNHCSYLSSLLGVTWAIPFWKYFTCESCYLSFPTTSECHQGVNNINCIGCSPNRNASIYNGHPSSLTQVM